MPMQEVIALADFEQQTVSLREQLFPDGQPTPDEFIRVVAAYIRGQLQNEEPEA